MGPGPEKLVALLEELSEFTDPQLRAELLIEYGERFKEVPPEIASRPFACENRVPSCESEAFVFPVVNEHGRLQFHFAVDNPQGISAKALAAILEETCSDAPLGEVAEIGDELVYTLFGRGISMGKGIGLRSMVQMVRAYAFEELQKRGR